MFRSKSVSNCESNNIYEKFLQILKEKQLENRILSEFESLADNRSRISFIERKLNEFDLLPIRKRLFDRCENNSESIRNRLKGNDYYFSRNFWNAIYYYNRSILLQTNPKLLALSLSNRSACLFELKRFTNCIQDIDKAIELNYPKEKLDKLLKRKKKSMQLLSEEQTELGIELERLPIKSYGQHAEIEAASDCLTIANDNKSGDGCYGRYLRATRQIRPGDVILVEQPYVTQQLFEFANMICFNCQQFAYNLMPCKTNCSLALFCSDNCENEANRNGHRYECQYLQSAFLDNFSEIQLISLKALIKSKRETTNESKFEYRSQSFRELNALVTNEHCRSAGDRFAKTIDCLSLISLLNLTDFFDENSGAATTALQLNEELLRLLQIVSSNFHQIIQFDRFESNNFLQIGHAGYTLLSLTNHSCYPNVFRVYYGNKVVLIAESFIENGEQIFDCYSYRFTRCPKSKRKSELLQQYFFDCKCQACEKNWPTCDALPDFFEFFEIDRNQYNLICTKSDRDLAKKLIGKLVRHLCTRNIENNNSQLLKELFLKYLLMISNLVLGNKKVCSL